jgi:hypothetical protein
MKCNEIKVQVYEWIKETISEKGRSAVEEHLRDCRSCQAYAEQVKHTLSLLNEIKPPPLSTDFRVEILKKARYIPLPSKPVWQRITEWFQIPYVKWPLEGVAVTAVILIALAIYKDVSLTKPSKIEMTPRSFQLELPETPVKHPIILTVMDLKEAQSNFKELVEKFDGRLVQSQSQDKGVRVTVNLKRDKEKEFLSRLKKLGQVKVEPEGFRDNDGNIIVLLKLK